MITPVVLSAFMAFSSPQAYTEVTPLNLYRESSYTTVSDDLMFRYEHDVYESKCNTLTIDTDNYLLTVNGIEKQHEIKTSSYHGDIDYSFDVTYTYDVMLEEVDGLKEVQLTEDDKTKLLELYTCRQK